MEEVERKAPESFRDTPPSHWFWHAGDTRVKIKTHELNINSGDQHRNLTVEVYRKPTQRNSLRTRGYPNLAFLKSSKGGN